MKERFKLDGKSESQHSLGFGSQADDSRVAFAPGFSAAHGVSTRLANVLRTSRCQLSRVSTCKAEQESASCAPGPLLWDQAAVERPRVHAVQSPSRSEFCLRTHSIQSPTGSQPIRGLSCLSAHPADRSPRSPPPSDNPVRDSSRGAGAMRPPPRSIGASLPTSAARRHRLCLHAGPSCSKSVFALEGKTASRLALRAHTPFSSAQAPLRSAPPEPRRRRAQRPRRS